MPEDEEVKRGKWTFAHLPAIPSRFALKPIEKSEARLRLLLKLLKRKDVSELVNACDAGREGELIFRNIAQYAKNAKPIRRLWLQSMTQGAIREAFGALRSDEAMRPLADAAVCRSESDWLVGINGTRAMTAFNSRSGGFQLTTVGRVQTPTLAILVEREEKIRAFVPRGYWEVLGTFPRRRRAVRRPLVRREIQEVRRRSRPSGRAPVGRGPRPRDRRALRRQAGHGHRGDQAVDAGRAASLRPDQPAARSQRPLRPVGAHDAVARAGAVRKTQGPDLSANRFARAARGLPAHRQGDDGSAARVQRLRGVRRPDPQVEMGQAQQADLRRQQDLGPLRDHPDLAAAEEPFRARGQALRPGRQALPRSVLSARRIPADDADHARRRRAVQDRGQGAGLAGLARGLRQGSSRRRRCRRSRRSARTKRWRPRKSRWSRARRGRRRASPRRRCCRRWKARAS